MNEWEHLETCWEEAYLESNWKLEAAKTRKQTLNGTNLYNKKSQEVKRSCRLDKRREIDETIQGAGVAAEQRDLQKVFDITKLLSGQRTV